MWAEKGLGGTTLTLNSAKDMSKAWGTILPVLSET